MNEFEINRRLAKGLIFLGALALCFPLIYFTVEFYFSNSYRREVAPTPALVESYLQVYETRFPPGTVKSKDEIRSYLLSGKNFGDFAKFTEEQNVGNASSFADRLEWWRGLFGELPLWSLLIAAVFLESGIILWRFRTNKA